MECSRTRVLLPWVGWMLGFAVSLPASGAAFERSWRDSAAPWPPHLLLDDADFGRINSWAEAYDWAATARNGILNRADSWPDAYLARWQLDAFELPPEGGQWTQYYVCPVHGYPLTFVDATTHQCPMGETYSGWPYDQVIYTRRIDDAANTALDLGLAYRLTGAVTYAAAAGDILRAFADVYLTWPIHDEHDLPMIDGARAHAQTLDEAVWLIPIAWAYDLVADSPALGDEDRARIQGLLLRPAAQVLQHYKQKGNWQVWHNAGIAAVGYTLLDQDLIDVATSDRAGMEHLLQLGVNEDGLWWEGTWSYHFYALQPFTYFAEMSRRAGVDYYADPHLAAMFTAPLDVLLPDLTLPPFNDSHATSITAYAWAYEVAWSRLGDPRAAWVAGMVTRGRWGLFFGTETLPDETAPTQHSVLLEDSGYAVLRQSGPDDTTTYVALDFGPHGGWHGHYDKLSFLSHGAGEIMGLDPGTQSYAAPTHDTWDKKTVAHNTVVMDERNQVRNCGNLTWFHALRDVSAIRADAGGAYPAARAARTQVLVGEYLLDRFDIGATAPSRHTFDWLYHNPGMVNTDLPLTPYEELPEAWGYQHLTEARGAEVSGAWQVVFSNSEGSAGCRVWMDGPSDEAKGGIAGSEASGTTVVVGEGLGPDLSEPVPFVMARRAGVGTTFAALFEPFRGAWGVSGFETRPGSRLSDGDVVLQVEVTGRPLDREGYPEGAVYTDSWALVGRNSGETWVAGDLTGDGDLALVRRVQGEIRLMLLAGGSFLSEPAQVLIRAEAPIAGLQARLHDDGLLEVDTEAPLECEVFIHAPGTTRVLLDGEEAAWSITGDMVWLPPQ